MGSRYEAVKKLEPLIQQLILLREREDGLDKREQMKQTVELLEQLDRRSLWMIETVREVGFSGRGCRIRHTAEAGGYTLDYFPMPIEDSVDQLLARYSKLLEYRSKKELVIRLAGYLGVAEELSEGLRLLRELRQDDPSMEDWPEPARLEPHPEWEVEIVLLGTFMDHTWAYAFRKDAAQRLPELQLEFDQWRSSLDHVSPFIQFYEEYAEDGELIDQGYRSQYGPPNFVDWLNAQSGEYVGWPTKPPEHSEGLAVLNF